MKSYGVATRGCDETLGSRPGLDGSAGTINGDPMGDPYGVKTSPNESKWVHSAVAWKSRPDVGNISVKACLLCVFSETVEGYPIYNGNKLETGEYKAVASSKTRLFSEDYTKNRKTAEQRVVIPNLYPSPERRANV
jgi:hypothetical protein